MAQQILFIQGAGQGAYAEDKKLAESLQSELGAAYNVQYPQMPEEDASEDGAGWKEQIAKELAVLDDGMILVAHSFGGSILLKYLSEEKSPKSIAGLFLIALPYFGAEGWNMLELALPNNFAAQLPEDVPIFFYHSRDDEEVPLSHLESYKVKLPQATFREFTELGGHQFNNDLSKVAQDIERLQRSYSRGLRLRPETMKRELSKV